ncbi:MAG: N-acetyltransferase [Actinomycetota bacterium]|nr:N-acetyltransferase [Actinomycetota bacterium]
MSWLPEGFEHPARLDLASGHHLRPIRADDVDIDFPAVMGSRARLWSIYGEAWGWPPATMTPEQDRDDLAYHEDEMATAGSYNYAVLDTEERHLLGCVYIDPPVHADADAVVSWWVVDDEVGGRLDAALADAVPRWLEMSWPFTTVFFGVESVDDDPEDGPEGDTGDAPGKASGSAPT